MTLDIKKLKTYIKDYETVFHTKEIDMFSNNIKEDAMIIAINELSKADRALIILYSELGSYRKMSFELNVSHQTIKNEITRIKILLVEKIKKILERYDN